jgi:hypothetical protein
VLWSTLFDTFFEDGGQPDSRIEPGQTYELRGRSIAVLWAVPRMEIWPRMLPGKAR